MTDTRTKFYLKDYKAPAYWQNQIDLNFNLLASHTEIIAKSRFVRNSNLTENTNEISLNGTHLKLISIKVDGKNHPHYIIDESTLILQKIPNEFELEVITHIDPSSNKSMEGLYLTNGLYCTQCEAQGFRKITYFLDRPDNMAVFSVRIEADSIQFPFLLSNGNPLETGNLSNGRHFAKWHDPFPKPAHLFALVAGDLDFIQDTYRTQSGREVQLKVFANKGRKARCHHAMNSLKWSFKWDEDRYGLEYDLDLFMIVAVDDFNMGAMENKGLNIYNSGAALADIKTADDATHFRITSIVGHEYFHNWSGNRVNCRDWFQLSLKEGLTVYRDQEFTADLFSRPVQRLSDVTSLRESQFNEDSGPNAHPVRPDSAYSIDNFYTSTIYEKGAELIRMLETILGKSKFEEGLKSYFKMYDGQAVTTDDFVKAMELVSGEDFTHFKKWYTQSGTPHVQASGTYNAATQEFKLKLVQSTAPTAQQSIKEALFIPVKIGLLDKEGKDLIDPNTLLRLKQFEETFVFKNIPEAPTPSLFRDFSAPVNYSYEYTMDDYLFLMQHDSNRFNRWEAAQRVLTDTVFNIYNALVQQKPFQIDPKIFSGLKANIELSDVDPNFTSYMLQVPSYAQLQNKLKNIEPQLLCQSIAQLESSIGKQLEENLSKCFQQYAAKEPFELSPRALGERRLARVSLNLLCATRDSTHFDHALQYFLHESMEAKNASLHALIGKCETTSNKAIASFYKDFATDPLLFDRWIRLYVSNLTNDISAQLSKVYDDPHFGKTNPNNNVSVWWGFKENMAGFHQKDGSVYKILSQKIIEIDSYNEQIAARLANIFSNWKKYSEPYASLMKVELEKIIQTPKLSSNTYEIVSNALKDT